MKVGGRVHRLWSWWTEAYWEVRGHEITPPEWPWRAFCLVHGHGIVDDQCLQPEHRFCWVCHRGGPGQATALRLKPGADGWLNARWLPRPLRTFAYERGWLVMPHETVQLARADGHRRYLAMRHLWE